MQLFELTSADGTIAFSPFVWRTRLQLLAKGIPFDRVPWNFLDKDTIEASEGKTVPVIKDGDTWVSDSFGITNYLDATYPDKPLLGSAEAIAAGRFTDQWANAILVRGLFPMVAFDVWKLLDGENADYFRSTREKVLGTTLEAAADAARPGIDALHAAMMPVASTLSKQPYLGGDTIGYGDTVIFGTLMWARCVSTIAPVPQSGPLADWFGTMLNAFDGHALNAKAVGA